MRQADCRDDLEKLIDGEFDSRYQFCKKTGVPQDTLSRILNKKRDPSLRLLNAILDSLGYELAFQRTKPSPSSSRADSREADSSVLEVELL
jgi:transcriptional regulator with XRE-family HTH domain